MGVSRTGKRTRYYAAVSRRLVPKPFQQTSTKAWSRDCATDCHPIQTAQADHAEHTQAGSNQRAQFVSQSPTGKGQTPVIQPKSRVSSGPRRHASVGCSVAVLSKSRIRSPN